MCAAVCERERDSTRQTKVDNKRQGVRIRGGGVAAAASAPSVTPIESRISGDMSRDLAAPSATASSCRAPRL